MMDIDFNTVVKGAVIRINSIKYNIVALLHQQDIFIQFILSQVKKLKFYLFRLKISYGLLIITQPPHEYEYISYHGQPEPTANPATLKQLSVSTQETLMKLNTSISD